MRVSTEVEGIQITVEIPETTTLPRARRTSARAGARAGAREVHLYLLPDEIEAILKWAHAGKQNAGLKEVKRQITAKFG